MESVKKIVLSVVVISIAVSIRLSAQNEIKFTHITAEDGLSLNVVTKIIQDSRGYMWFGTYNGLNRFDGYNFKVFLPVPSEANGLSNHSIWSLLEDSDGYIWIGTNDGLNKYDWKTEKFTVYNRDPKNPKSVSDHYILSIYEDREGTIWIGTQNGLDRYNKETDNFTVIKKVSDSYNKDSLNAVTCIEEDKRGNLWLGAWDGLSCLGKDGRISKVALPGLNDSSITLYNEISDITEDKYQNLWIGTKGKGLYRYNLNTGFIVNYKNNPDDFSSISGNYISVIYKDKLDNLWIGTKDGLNIFNYPKNNFSRFQNDLFKSTSIINNDVLSFCEDKTGVFWVGTSAGISKFYLTPNKFYYHKENKIDPAKGLSSSAINSVYCDKKNNIWVATGSGLDEIKDKGGAIIHLKNDPQNSNSLRNNKVMTVMEDRAGMIWIGSDGGGLNRYDPSTGLFSFYEYSSNDNTSLSTNGVISLCEDHRGFLWVGTWWGLNRLDSKKGKFVRYFHDENNRNGLSNNLIWAIYEDSKNMIWIGTDGGGVDRFNPDTDSFTTFMHDSSNNSISGNRVVSISESRDGIMWFCTTNGLSSYNRATRKFTVYNKDNGLPSLLICGIKEDANGFLWIGSDKGLTKFNRKTEQFYNFNKRDGLEETEFSANVACQTSDNKIFFGGKTSLMYFNPDSIREETLSAPLVFTDLKVYNQSIPVSSNGNTILNESITSTKEIRIPSDKEVITIEFALLDYFNVKNNTFQYRLSGFENRWNNVGTRNNATYTNLPPGEYTFIVKGTINNQKINEEKASLKITIVPAFYQTWWFKSVLVIIIIFITIVIVQLTIRSIKKQNKILETKVADRTKDLDKIIRELSQEINVRKKAEATVQYSLEEKGKLLEEKEVLLKEIHHRVKNNLQVISSLLYLNSKKSKDSETLNMFKDSQNRVKSIALVHERLYQSKDLGKIDFKEYVQRLTKDLLRSYAVDQTQIQLNIDINKLFINIDLAVPCGLIINELVSNSLKYAFPKLTENNNGGIIKIEFNENGNNELLMIVSDNGVGMPEGLNDRKKLSLGLQLVDTLVSQLDGSLEIDPQNGTAFKIKFPNFKN